MKVQENVVCTGAANPESFGVNILEIDGLRRVRVRFHPCDIVCLGGSRNVSERVSTSAQAIFIQNTYCSCSGESRDKLFRLIVRSRCRLSDLGVFGPLNGARKKAITVPVTVASLQYHQVVKIGFRLTSLENAQWDIQPLQECELPKCHYQASYLRGSEMSRQSMESTGSDRVVWICLQYDLHDHCPSSIRLRKICKLI